MYVPTKKTGSNVSWNWNHSTARQRRKRSKIPTKSVPHIIMRTPEKTWGDVNDYHMILDTSELGVDNCANILMQYFERLEYI
mgnify:CR=1 FL=1